MSLRHGSDASQQDALTQVPLKRRRITKACDFCHRRGRKCKLPPETEGSSGSPASSGKDVGQHPNGGITCLTCIEHGTTCTWTRIAAKRGVKTKPSSSSEPSTDKGPHLNDGDENRPWAYDESRHGSRSTVHRLITIFFDTVFPVFPFFHEDGFLEEWATSSLSSNRAAFSTLMAVCALSSCHVKDGALFTPRLAGSVTSDRLRTFLEDADRAIPEDILDPDTYRYLQSIGTLSLVAIQIGDVPLLHRFLGLYHTVVARHNIHNESRWPPVSPAEKQVRRQFFWSMYRIEVHCALIMGHVMRCPETQSAVAYPAAFGDPGSMPSLSSAGMVNGGWVTGWNYITDLYRVLEHVIVRLRSRKINAIDRGKLYSNVESLLPPVDAILTKVLEQRKGLGKSFEQALPLSGDVEANRCGFQVANIACTLQLLKMTSFTCQDVTFRDACGAALELIDGIGRIPVEYLRAIGSPMLQELAGVGHLLSSFIGRRLLSTEYLELRAVMDAMAMFLETLGLSLPAALMDGMKLRRHIHRIDDYLNNHQTLIPAPLIPPVPIPSAAANVSVLNELTTLNDTKSYTEIPMEFFQTIPWPGYSTEGDWANSFDPYNNG